MLNQEKSATGGKNQNILILILIAIISAGGGFFAGSKYQPKQIANQRTQFVGQFGNRGQVGDLGAREVGNNRMAGFRGGQILGDIISADDKSITVKLADGSSKIILFSSSTSINKAAEAGLEDLKAGEKVAVFGSNNTDGSISAQNIQLNPITRERFQGATITPVN